MCTHSKAGDISSDPNCNKCLAKTIGILNQIKDKEVSASMSGIEYYSECVDKAAGIIADAVRFECGFNQTERV